MGVLVRPPLRACRMASNHFRVSQQSRWPAPTVRPVAVADTAHLSNATLNVAHCHAAQLAERCQAEIRIGGELHKQLFAAAVQAHLHR